MKVERVLNTLLNDLMNKPVLLLTIVGFTFILLTEIEFIEGDNMAWINETINEKAFGGKVLQTVLRSVENNLYKVTLIVMCLIMAIFITGEQVKFINVILAIFIVMTSVDKNKFIAYACFLYAEYFYFTIRHSVLRLVIVLLFIAAFYLEVNLKADEVIANTNNKGSGNQIPKTKGTNG